MRLLTEDPRGSFVAWRDIGIVVSARADLGSAGFAIAWSQADEANALEFDSLVWIVEGGRPFDPAACDAAARALMVSTDVETIAVIAEAATEADAIAVERFAASWVSSRRTLKVFTSSSAASTWLACLSDEWNGEEPVPEVHELILWIARQASKARRDAPTP